MFEVIKGGLSESRYTSCMEFDMAYITDTRLMGVNVMGVKWKLPENEFITDFYQLFYLDSEEFGLDTYKSFATSGDDDEYYEMLDAEREMLSGLGANRVPLTEKEVRYLVQTYMEFNHNRMMPLPDNSDELSAVFSKKVSMNENEEESLMEKMCEPVETAYKAINYFIMRCVGRDFEAARFLTRHFVRTDLFPNLKMGALLKNTITDAIDEESGYNAGYYRTDSDDDFTTFRSRKVYRCESVVDSDNKFYILVTEVTLEGVKVVGYEKISMLRISATEAARITSQPEFVTLCAATVAPEEIDITSTEMMGRSLVSLHESGRLFMVFYRDNSHVDRPVFRLNGDVEGIYYVTNTSQIIMAGYSREAINRLEADLMQSSLQPYIIPLSKYQFQEPVLLGFTESGLDDFEEFVDMISETEDEN